MQSNKQHNDPVEDSTPIIGHKTIDPGSNPWIRCLMQVLWPAFCGAAFAVGILFSLIDPIQIEWVHVYLNDSREAAYTVGFLSFWLLFATTNSFTWYLAYSESSKH